jgi:hypothetical protein
MRISKIYVKLNKSDFCGNVRTKMSENQRLVCVCTLVHCHCSSACKHAIRAVLCIIEIKVRAAGMSVWPRVSLFHVPLPIVCACGDSMKISKIYVKLNKSDFCGNVRTKNSENPCQSSTRAPTKCCVFLHNVC